MYERILVPVDGSATATRGVREAVRLAGGQAARICLLYVTNDANMAMAESAYPTEELWKHIRADGEAVLKEARDIVVAAGGSAETLLLDARVGVVGALIVDQARSWHADVIVMGTHGRRGLGRMIVGSTAVYVLRHTDVPMLLVRHA